MKLWTPSYIRVAVAFTLVVMTSEVFRFVLPLLAFELSEKAFDISIVRGFAFVPSILLGIAIGVFNDSINLPRAYRSYILFMAFVIGILFCVLLTDGGGVFEVTFALMCFMAGFAAFGNAQVGITKSLLPKPLLVRSSSLMGGVQNFATVAGPVLGGLLLAVSGAKAALLACSLALVLAWLQLIFARLPQPERNKRSFLNALLDGLRAFWGNSNLVIMSIVVAIINATEGLYAASLIVLLKASMGTTDTTIGLILSVAGAGAIVGASITPVVRERLGTWPTFVAPIPVIAMLYALAAVSRSEIALALIAFNEGVFSSIFVVSIWSYRQETVPAEVMGRVAGITGAVFKIGMPPMILIGGWFQSTVSAAAPFVLAATVNILVFLVLVLKLPRGIGN